MAVDTIKPVENAKIRAVYTPSEENQKWRHKVYQRKTDMAATRSKYEADWDKWMKQYEAWRPPKDVNDWQSTIVPPFTTSIVEAEMSELVDQLQLPKVAARGEEDKPKALILNYILKYLWEIGNGDIEAYKAIKEALILGTGIVQEYYWKDSRQVRTLVRYDPEKGVEEYEEKEIADFDDEYMEAVKIQDFYIDENARSINSGPYKANDCIRRYIIPTETFKQVYKGKIWNPLNAAQYVVSGGDTNYYEYYKPPQGINKDEVEVLWYWSRNPDKLIIVANDVIIRNNPNPYNHKQLPFAQAVDVMRPHQFYHKGEPELLDSIQEELTVLRRQRIDRAHLDTDKMFLVSNREVLTDQDLIVAPHKPIFVEDPNNSIKPLEYSQTPSTAYLEEDRLKEDGERVTGIDIRSLSVKASGSATEAAILKEATLRRLRMKLWLIARTLFVEQTRLRVANIMQHYKEPKMQAILGTKEPELQAALEMGKVKNFNGQKFLETPRTIRTTDIKLERSPSGMIKETDKKGENYFDVQPEDVVPSKGGFDIKLTSEPTFPVSKPLLQQKVNELFQHPVMRFAIQSGLIDLKKATDKLLEINDFDPDDFQAREEAKPAIDPQKMIDMANFENESMARGEDIPGTPFAPREHTDIHLAFMASGDFKQAFQADQGIVDIFVKHISQEEAAQLSRPTAREAVPGAPGETGAAPMNPMEGNAAMGVEASPAQAAQPARAVGPTPIAPGPGQGG